MLPEDEDEPVGPARLSATRAVLIEGLELIGSIGVYEREHRYQQRIIVSLRLDVSDRYDGSSDKIGDVYDYDHAVRAVQEAVSRQHYNLIETLAERIARQCLAHRDVVSARVRIEKPDVIDGCRAVGIEIVRVRR